MSPPCLCVVSAGIDLSGIDYDTLAISRIAYKGEVVGLPEQTRHHGVPGAVVHGHYITYQQAAVL